MRAYKIFTAILIMASSLGAHAQSWMDPSGPVAATVAVTLGVGALAFSKPSASQALKSVEMKIALPKALVTGDPNATGTKDVKFRFTIMRRRLNVGFKYILMEPEFDANERYVGRGFRDPVNDRPFFQLNRNQPIIIETKGFTPDDLIVSRTDDSLYILGVKRSPGNYAARYSNHYSYDPPRFVYRLNMDVVAPELIRPKPVAWWRWGICAGMAACAVVSRAADTGHADLLYGVVGLLSAPVPALRRWWSAAEAVFFRDISRPKNDPIFRVGIKPFGGAKPYLVNRVTRDGDSGELVSVDLVSEDRNSTEVVPTLYGKQAKLEPGACGDILGGAVDNTSSVGNSNLLGGGRAVSGDGQSNSPGGDAAGNAGSTSGGI